MKCERCGHPMYTDRHHDGTEYAKCICGNLKPVNYRVGHIQVRHSTPADGVSLPRTGSKSHNCLGALASIFPATTEQIAALVEQGNSETASQLGALRVRGLVDTTSCMKGVKGGSTWTLTLAAKHLLNF